jgi:hypothetical protein
MNPPINFTRQCNSAQTLTDFDEQKDNGPKPVYYHQYPDESYYDQMYYLSPSPNQYSAENHWAFPPNQYRVEDKYSHEIQESFYYVTNDNLQNDYTQTKDHQMYPSRLNSADTVTKLLGPQFDSNSYDHLYASYYTNPGYNDLNAPQTGTRQGHHESYYDSPGPRQQPTPNTVEPHPGQMTMQTPNPRQTDQNPQSYYGNSYYRASAYQNGTTLLANDQNGSLPLPGGSTQQNQYSQNSYYRNYSNVEGPFRS